MSCTVTVIVVAPSAVTEPGVAPIVDVDAEAGPGTKVTVTGPGIGTPPSAALIVATPITVDVTVAVYVPFPPATVLSVPTPASDIVTGSVPLVMLLPFTSLSWTVITELATPSAVTVGALRDSTDCAAAGAPASTVTGTLTVIPFTCAVTVVVPFAIPVTSPVDETVATPGASDAHVVTGFTIRAPRSLNALSCNCWVRTAPEITTLAGVTDTRAAVFVMRSASVANTDGVDVCARITTSPVSIAVTLPDASMVAREAGVAVHVRPVAATPGITIPRWFLTSAVYDADRPIALRASVALFSVIVNGAFVTVTRNDLMRSTSPDPSAAALVAVTSALPVPVGVICPAGTDGVLVTRTTPVSLDDQVTVPTASGLPAASENRTRGTKASSGDTDVRVVSGCRMTTVSGALLTETSAVSARVPNCEMMFVLPAPTAVTNPACVTVATPLLSVDQVNVGTDTITPAALRAVASSVCVRPTDGKLTLFVLSATEVTVFDDVIVATSVAKPAPGRVMRAVICVVPTSRTPATPLITVSTTAFTDVIHSTAAPGIGLPRWLRTVAVNRAVSGRAEIDTTAGRTCTLNGAFVTTTSTESRRDASNGLTAFTNFRPGPTAIIVPSLPTVTTLGSSDVHVTRA